MRELLYYILAAVGGGIMAEINNSNGVHKKDLKILLIRGFTSAMIGIVFGLLFEVLTGNVKVTVSITTLAGFIGLPSIEWLIKFLKGKAGEKFKK